MSISIETHPSAYRNHHSKVVDLFVKSCTETFRLHINQGNADSSLLQVWLNENHPGHELMGWGFWKDLEEEV